MAGVKGKSGGKRPGQGRPSKSDELKLIEKLDKHIDQDAVLVVLNKLALGGDIKAVQLYLNYRYGKPRETKDITLDVENNFPKWFE